MKKSFSSVMIIIGTVIGSGFASGKEVAVFFSRFGNISYFLISLCFFFFFFVIHFFMNCSHILNKLQNSKIFSFLCLIISLIFTSSMLAGTIQVVPQNFFLKTFVVIFLIVVAVVVIKKGVNSLAIINNLIIPFTVVSMLVVLFSNWNGVANVPFSQNAFAGAFFSVLYILLNFSFSGIVISKTGENLTKKQKASVSLISSFVLSALLLITNIVLLSNPESISEQMPLLSISGFPFSMLIRFVIFSGCITTFFSLVWTSRLALKRFGVETSWSVLIAVILPLLISVLGFGSIVSFLYPIASIVGVGLFLIEIAFYNKKC